MTLGPGGAGPLRVVFYISGHGFGHAARDIQIVNALGRLEPDSRIVIRTSVPEWFLRSSLEHPAEIASGEVDTGMVQPDGLSIDEDESARRAAVFYHDFTQKVAVERDLLRGHDPAVVIGDIPPLAFAAAAAVGVPSIAVSNFTWDWIYEAYPAFDTHAPGVRRLIADADAQATLGLRLPFWGGFASMPRVEDVPLVARTASVARDDVRARLGLPGGRPLVLATFGGHGRSVPLDVAASDGRFTVVATDYEVGKGSSPHPNLHVVSADDLRRTALSYTDLLAACDVVATKLGYGIVSECLANHVPLLYALRGRFPEQDVFIREMPALMRSLMIGADDLRAGRWASAIEALLAQPEPAQAVRCDGADVIARRVLEEVGRELRVP